jgi:hypothetical protein
VQALTPAERERGAHQFQEAAAPDRIEPLRGVLREFAVQEFLELGGLRQRFEAAPVLPSLVPSSRARSASMSFGWFM